MLRSRDFLAAAPMTAEVQADLRETTALAFESPTAAYGSHVRKSAQFRETLRRRGRHGREPGLHEDGP
jgi:hypothetical protein